MPTAVYRHGSKGGVAAFNCAGRRLEVLRPFTISSFAHWSGALGVPTSSRCWLPRLTALRYRRALARMTCWAVCQHFSWRFTQASVARFSMKKPVLLIIAHFPIPHSRPQAPAFPQLVNLSRAASRCLACRSALGAERADKPGWYLHERWALRPASARMELAHRAPGR